MSSTNLKIVFVVASGLLLLGSSLAMAQQSRVANVRGSRRNPVPEATRREASKNV